MKLGTKGRYAVMAVVDVHKNVKQGPVPLSDVSGRQGISQSYLEQIFNKLKRHKIVESVRGVKGGYILGQPAKNISVAQVMMSVDEPLHATRCGPSGTHGCMDKGERCALHGLWDELGKRIYTFLSDVSIADISSNKPKCSGHKQILSVQEDLSTSLIGEAN